jgi:alpha-mannosidase
MFWQSPDGSKLPAILFANWYNNGVEIPENGDKEYWDRVLSSAEKYASTDELLIMNGCDHQPVQKNLSKALENARKNYPEYDYPC